MRAQLGRRQVFRASRTVQSQGGVTPDSPIRVHDAVNTEESNAALWAAMKGAFLRSGKRVGASSANDGLPFTIGYDMPWIAVNSNSGLGGQIRLVKTESTTPSTTDTTDTAHALSRERFAVSKSIATKVDPSGSGIIFVRTRRAFGVAA